VALPAGVRDAFAPERVIVSRPGALTYVLLSLATLSLVLPVSAAWRGWRGLSRAQKLFAAYLGLELAGSVAEFGLGRLNRPNLWIAHVVVPVETVILLRVFAEWQMGPRMATGLRWASWPMLLFWIPAIVGWEPKTGFAIGSESIQAIICLAVAAYTTVSRQQQDVSRAVEEPWFWIGTGVMLYFATFALLSPLAGYLLKLGSTTVFGVLGGRAAFQVLANLLFYFGMRCQQSRLNSGPSTSPRRL
jgi:hypothetical protein